MTVGFNWTFTVEFIRFVTHLCIIIMEVYGGRRQGTCNVCKAHHGGNTIPDKISHILTNIWVDASLPESNKNRSANLKALLLLQLCS